MAIDTAHQLYYAEIVVILPNSERFELIGDLEQQGCGCDPQKTRDHFPQVISRM
jgi:hypothetical protein